MSQKFIYFLKVYNSKNIYYQNNLLISKQIK
jgi:hypothetical protein